MVFPYVPMNLSPSSGPTATAAAPSHDEIAVRARELWIEFGQPEGRNDAIWLEAEHRLSSALPVPDMTAAIWATLSQPVTSPLPEAGTMPSKGRRGL